MYSHFKHIPTAMPSDIYRQSDISVNFPSSFHRATLLLLGYCPQFHIVLLVMQDMTQINYIASRILYTHSIHPTDIPYIIWPIIYHTALD